MTHYSARARWNTANARLANKPFDDLFSEKRICTCNNTVPDPDNPRTCGICGGGGHDVASTNPRWLQPISDAKRDAEKQQEQIRQADQPKCACLEYIGDNPACKQHGHLYKK